MAHVPAIVHDHLAAAAGIVAARHIHSDAPLCAVWPDLHDCGIAQPPDLLGLVSRGRILGIAIPARRRLQVCGDGRQHGAHLCPVKNHRRRPSR
jgi:hypothetical protein